MNLVTKADFDGLDFKYLTINLNDVEINAIINEAQRVDVRPFLGAPFYKDILDNLLDQRIIDLLDGVDYDYHGDTVHYDGLKIVILYYTYARYILNMDGVSTPYGIKSKIDQYSIPMNPKSIQMKVDSARSSANSYLHETEKFLIEKSTDYPLWRCDAGIKRKGGAVISVVDKNKHKHNESTFVSS